MRKYISILILVLSFTFSVAAKDSSIESRYYQEETGKDKTKTTWQIEEQKDSIVLTSTKSSGKTDIYTSNASLANLEWESKYPGQNTDIVGKRKKNYILVTGNLKGATINKKIKIDSAPWYQSLSFSLSSLAKSDKRSSLFWVLRPNDFTPIKMKARKLAPESVKIQGKQVEAEKIKVVLTGFKSMLWHGLYWFKKEDGAFIRYEGVNGPPGTPLTITTFVGTKE